MLIRTLGVFCVVVVGSLSSAGLWAQSNALRPEAHFRVEKPARLNDAQALSIYEQIVDQMVAGYLLSRDHIAENYRKWRRFNTAPYVSATHGQRYVSNYANSTGRDYGRFEEVSRMPVGSVIVKDAFTVTADGGVFPGPLAIMEKMPEGFNPDGRDWKYTEIMPDGSMFGETGGFNSEGVEFCVTCHQSAGDDNDHLFFIPEEYRRTVLLELE